MAKQLEETKQKAEAAQIAHDEFIKNQIVIATKKK